MHNDWTRWYTEWTQQVHQNELNPPIQLSLYVNRLNVTYKTIITSHFCNRTSDMRVTSTWSWSTTRRIEEMNKVSWYKTNTSIMLCECTQYGHECDNSSEIPLSTYIYSYVITSEYLKLHHMWLAESHNEQHRHQTASQKLSHWFNTAILFSKEATLYSFHQGFSLVCDHSRILLYISALTETRCGFNHWLTKAVITALSPQVS